MRVKTEAKREAILAVAGELFCDHGFEGTSMSAIAARVGGSKGTLYNYFPSKEDLFIEVMTSAAERQRDQAFIALEGDGPLAERMTQASLHYLRFATSALGVSMLRAFIAESGKTDIGRRFYERGPREGWLHVQNFFDTAVARGQLRACDTAIATQHFKALCEAGLVEPMLLGVLDPLADAALHEQARRAVEVFLLAYGP